MSKEDFGVELGIFGDEVVLPVDFEDVIELDKVLVADVVLVVDFLEFVNELNEEVFNVEILLDEELVIMNGFFVNERVAEVTKVELFVVVVLAFKLVETPEVDLVLFGNFDVNEIVISLPRPSQLQNSSLPDELKFD